MPWLNNRGQLSFSSIVTGFVVVLVVCVMILFFYVTITSSFKNTDVNYALETYNPAMLDCHEWTSLDTPRIKHSVTDYKKDGSIVNNVFYNNIEIKDDDAKSVDVITREYRYCSNMSYVRYNASIHQCKVSINVDLAKNEEVPIDDIIQLTAWGTVYFQHGELNDTNNESMASPEAETYEASTKYNIEDLKVNTDDWLFYRLPKGLGYKYYSSQYYNSSICTKWDFREDYMPGEKIFTVNKFTKCEDKTTLTCATFDYIKQDNVEIKFDMNRLCICGVQDGKEN